MTVPPARPPATPSRRSRTPVKTGRRPGGQPPRQPGRRPVRWSSRIAGGLALMVITASGIGHAVVSGVDKGIDRVDAFGGMRDRPGGSKGMNFLLVGTDGRDGLDPDAKKRYHLGGAPCHCTDTIMLVHLSENRARASVVSIPRDSYAMLPEHVGASDGVKHASHPAKINAAYADGGPSLSVATVEKMTGVHIDHYLELDFTSFMKTVDVIGGVQVCTVRRLQDSYTGLDLPVGTSTLTGGEALQYVRSRHLDGAADLGRMQRQQRFLAQIIHRVTSGGLLTNPVKLSEVASTVLGSVRADQDLRPKDLIALAQGMRGFTPGSSEFTSVPIGVMGFPVKGIGSTVKWDDAKAGKLWAAIRADQPLAVHAPAQAPVQAKGPATGPADAPATGPAPKVEVDVDPGSVRVKVDNGTAVSGLGDKADKALRATGFATTRAPGNANVHNVPRTVIRYDPRWDRSAKSLAVALPGAELVPATGQGPVMQVTIGAGYRGVTPVRAQGLAPAAGTATGAVTGDQVVCP
ncbi:LCP family protein [Streptomyces sp. H10-C2]|uniref:LCP family glycopolymer transferase n=1 Tax=unclassified Streptomyces TaxID=2593676 RepID=UPI0024B965A9|nr:MULTISPECIES: LCP family protein [unclassified Streptomyces]MDJ0341270.1 LCP family protein [Streptomyces sp. PH10-H1]MDJ0370865.1 LCP family protein [Streptomyces sp. H10-C2]